MTDSPFPVYIGDEILNIDPILSRRLYHQTLTGGLLEVRDYSPYRWMTFGSDAVQSAMHTGYPHLLIMPYMQAMMSCLLFNDNLKRGCILGFGGGALARYLRQSFPTMHLDAIESDEMVLAVSRRYFQINDTVAHIIVDDACAPAFTLHAYDVILVDLFNVNCLPACMYDATFYERCFAALNERGMAVFNVVAQDKEQFVNLLAMVRYVFNRATLCIDVVDQANIIILAFRSHQSEVSLRDLNSRTESVRLRFGLRFDLIHAALQRCNKIERDCIVMR